MTLREEAERIAESLTDNSWGPHVRAGVCHAMCLALDAAMEECDKHEFMEATDRIAKLKEGLTP